MELRQYFALFRRWWWLIVLLTVLGGAAGFAFPILQEPTYQATTTVLINQAPGSLPDAETVLQGQRIASTYAELLQQRPVLEQVINNLGLDILPEDLDRSVDVAPVRDTNLLEVNVANTDSRLAADIANEIVTVFIEQNLEFQASRYAASLDNLQNEMSAVQQDIEQIESRLEDIDGTGFELTAQEIAERQRLQDMLTEYRSNYATLLDRFEQVRLAQAQTTDKVTVVEEALPGRRVGQSALSFVLEGAAAGGLLATGLVIFINNLNDTVRSSEEAESLTGASVLGVIGKIRDSEDPSHVLVSAFQPRSPNAEAYRVLRANLDFIAADAPLRSIVVTSTGPVEGKTTTAANLAIALAQAGQRVILVDMDLRRPTLHKLFGADNRVGVSTALLQRGANVAEYVRQTDIEHLYLMPSGPLPPNPADLLQSNALVKLVEELQAHADVVIFDSPPVLAVADPALLARRCDVALVVVLAGQTKSVALQRATEQLSQTGVPRMGVVLNRVSASEEGYSYRYHYYYSSNGENGSRS